MDEASDRVDAADASESFELERFEYMRAGELQEWRQRAEEMIADGKHLERRVVEVCRTIHDRAGMKYLPLEALPTDGRAEADTELLARLREEVGQGLTRIAALEARLAELGRELRSGGPDGEEAFAERGERRS